jgi:dipeptide/tripeptide permease
MVAATHKKSSKKNIFHMHSQKAHHIELHVALKLYFFSFVLLLALSIVGYLYKNWPLLFIGVGLMFFTLLFFAILKKPTKNKKNPEPAKKQDTRIDKLVEKEIMLDRIKIKRKIAFFLSIFIFSLAPTYTGFTNAKWLTLIMGACLSLLSIIGLFINLGKLKHIKTAEELKDTSTKAESKQLNSEKNPKKVGFIALVLIVIALVNVIIFFLPKHLWLYVGCVLVVGIVIGIIIRFQSKKDKTPLQQEQKKVEVPVVDEDIKKVLKITDELLGNLPDDVINKFAKSQEFELYERVLNKYKVK